MAVNGFTPNELFFKVPPEPPSPVSGPAVRVSWREIFAVVLGVVLADATVYHGAASWYCSAGMAALIFGCSLLFWFGSVKPLFSTRSILVFFLLALVSLKLLWGGFVVTTVFALGLMFCFGLLQSGRKLRLPEIVDYAIQSVYCGGSGLNDFGRFLSGKAGRQSSSFILAAGLPALALGVFGTIFVLANRSLIELVQRWFSDLGGWVSQFSNWLPDALQIPFWVLAAWILTGMIRPYSAGLRNWILHYFDSYQADSSANVNDNAQHRVKCPWYAGCRNMLVAVIGLFAVYLVFEFQTLWFRTFPDGFCYSDYSHNGAAWLVVALALSTVVLTLIFRPPMYCDPRVQTVYRLAWAWSTLNFVLVLAVYNRLWLYVDFNGMTRLRVVALLGVTAVLIGFVMVVRKITDQKSFAWLLARFTWTVLLLALVYVILPVDLLVHRYNAVRILKGDLAPSVQITVQPLSDEAYLALLPLVRCEDEIIKQGVRAMLLEKFDQYLHQRFHASSPEGKYAWTQFRISTELLSVEIMMRDQYTWGLETSSERAQAKQRFVDYAYRWY